MANRWELVAGYASEHHSVISIAEMTSLGVSESTRRDWVAASRLDRIGPRSFAISGSEDTWHRRLAGALGDVGRNGFLAGRSSSQLYGLDGFAGDAVEVLVRRPHRMVQATAVVRSTRRPVPASDLRWVDGLRCLTPERTILDAPIFGFARSELEQAIDSAIRLRLVSESRLRRRAADHHRPGLRGGRQLLDALIDTGGESALERRFLTLVRRGGLPRPATQQVVRSGRTTVGRVDFVFPGGLVVEVTGHSTHASRAHRNRDAERANDLTATAHRRTLWFTYEHVVYDPAYVVATLRRFVGTQAA